eukprot:390561_1
MLGYYTTAIAFTAAFSRFWLTLYDFNYNQALYLQKIEKHIKHLNRNNIHQSNLSTLNFETTVADTPPSEIFDTNPNIENTPNTIFEQSLNQSWWIKHRGHFGKVKPLIICLSIVLIIYAIIVTYLRYLSKFLCLTFHFLYLFTVTICGIISIRNISKYRDEFFIHEEGSTVGKPALLFLALFGSAIVIDLFLGIIGNIISTILTYLAATVGISVFTLVTLRWVLHKYYTEFLLRDTLINNDKIIKITFNQCINHNEGYYIFFEYLIGEFAVEHLDFITDVIYIKNRFGGTLHRNESSDEILIEDDYFYWPLLPNKLYLSQNMRENNKYNAIMSVYNLYVKEGSVREINISWIQRQEIKRKITNMINNDNVDVIDMDIFDAAVDEALVLIKQAYTRFFQTKEYQIFANTFDEERKKLNGTCISTKSNKGVLVTVDKTEVISLNTT